jgi:predicted dinucleotide-binding enzyme
MILARLAREAGFDVTIAGSGAPLAIEAADVVILAIPLPAYRSLPAKQLEGKLVIDAMNYWWETDGHLPDFTNPLTSTSQTVQAFLAKARVVKALNHASLWELENLARPAGDKERRALAIAGDHPADVATASALIDALGFDPVEAGPLENGVMFEPGTEIFGADASAEELRTMLGRFWTSQRGLVVARARRNNA